MNCPSFSYSCELCLAEGCTFAILHHPPSETRVCTNIAAKINGRVIGSFKDVCPSDMLTLKDLSYLSSWVPVLSSLLLLCLMGILTCVCWSMWKNRAGLQFIPQQARRFRTSVTFHVNEFRRRYRAGLLIIPQQVRRFRTSLNLHVNEFRRRSQDIGRQLAAI